MDVSPSKDLFHPKKRYDYQDDEATLLKSMDLDDNEPLEEIFHLTLNHFYPSRCISLLQRSMGIPLDSPLDSESANTLKLQPFILNFNRQDLVLDAGSLRNYIIMGSRPTFPFTVITFLRQIRYNPFDLWSYATPEPPFPTKPASILHWDIDTQRKLLKPRIPSSTAPTLTSSCSTNDLDLMRVHCAWDIKRDELAQVIVWSNTAGLSNRVFELRYGDASGCFEINRDLEAFVCFCGCGQGKLEDLHIKLLLKSGILFWFPHKTREIPKGVRNFRHIQNEVKTFPPFLYLDLSARTKEEMETYTKATNLEIRGIDLCVVNRRLPTRFRCASEHANWHASVEVFYLFIEWTSRKVFYVSYQINPLNLTAKVIRISRLKDEDRKKLAIKHTHDCHDISTHLGVKHYPRWSSVDQSLSRIKLEELGLELKLDFGLEAYEHLSDTPEGGIGTDPSNGMEFSETSSGNEYMFPERDPVPGANFW